MTDLPWEEDTTLGNYGILLTTRCSAWVGNVDLGHIKVNLLYTIRPFETGLRNIFSPEGPEAWECYITYCIGNSSDDYILGIKETITDAKLFCNRHYQSNSKRKWIRSNG